MLEFALIRMSKYLSRSIRKYIRQEKARIRREIFDMDKQKEEIEKLYVRLGVTNSKDQAN